MNTEHLQRVCVRIAYIFFNHMESASTVRVNIDNYNDILLALKEGFQLS